jgi:hypothetical protein
LGEGEQIKGIGYSDACELACRCAPGEQLNWTLSIAAAVAQVEPVS